MPEWLTPILEALGGGPMGVVLIALGWAVFTLWRRVNYLEDARIADLKEYSAALRDQVVDVNRTLDALRMALEAGK